MSTNQFPVVQQVITSADMQRQFQTLLPPSVRQDKFTEVTIAAIQNSPEVLEADRDSLYRACLASARRGLLPDKREGALVIYKTNVGTKDQPLYVPMVQFLPMVEGIIKEMAKAGINAFAVSVYQNDEIALWNDDDGQHVEHKPNPFGDRGNFVGVFAAAKTPEGRPYVEAMNVADITNVARRSKQCYEDRQTGKVSLGGTWKSDYERMAQKSALHRLRKRLPITDEDALQNLKDLEEQSDIELPTGGSTASSSGSVSASPAAPPPAQIEAPKESAADEVLKPAPRARRSRVLQGVVQQAQAAEKIKEPFDDPLPEHGKPVIRPTEKAAAAAADTRQAPSRSGGGTAAATPPVEKRPFLTPAEQQQLNAQAAQAEPEYDPRDIL